ncbi:MAG: hypothetical protein WD341_10140 [Tistlia sp.]|uniref:hypothetical protein n=1 Tax=Tistlia sp. TaxID=3057121 RepID=UPI0034A42908
MDTILKSPVRSLLLGLLLVVPLLAFALPGAAAPDLGSGAFWSFAVRWLHIGAGILLVGLLWYVNLVLLPIMPRLPEEVRPGVAKILGPAVVLWMRWAGLAVAATGLLLAGLEGYLAQALSLGAIEGFAVARHAAIGLGIWLAILMIANLWLFIWPEQRIAVGLAGGEPDRRVLAARRALAGTRINLVLSLPMLFLMVAARHLL